MYYTKKDSLILSARIEGKRIEIVGVSLDTLSVIQCFGAYNKNNEYPNRIVDLVNSNAHLIKVMMIA
ncbi:MAG: PcfJ domain-containing protein [Muribaculaceae bacterium]|nr:PcfJ domain-containing protein [Muribaculaceae bacterium]